jgi:hypothetical protein
MVSAVRAAMAMTMGLSMAGGSSAISAAAPAIRPPSRPRSIMQATKLPLTTWFLAFYLIGQAKTEISSLELSRHLGINYDTAYMLRRKDSDG